MIRCSYSQFIVKVLGFREATGIMQPEPHPALVGVIVIVIGRLMLTPGRSAIRGSVVHKTIFFFIVFGVLSATDVGRTAAYGRSTRQQGVAGEMKRSSGLALRFGRCFFGHFREKAGPHQKGRQEQNLEATQGGSCIRNE